MERYWSSFSFLAGCWHVYPSTCNAMPAKPLRSLLSRARPPRRCRMRQLRRCRRRVSRERWSGGVLTWEDEYFVPFRVLLCPYTCLAHRRQRTRALIKRAPPYPHPRLSAECSTAAHPPCRSRRLPRQGAGQCAPYPPSL
eukprot:scaffold1377_cov390-Prasinococcus_capsulatus_cf.AAC.4